MHGSTWNWWLFKAQVVQKTQWPIFESIRLIILGPGFNSHQSFGQWLKVLANLTNLANLFTRNLGKTPLFGKGFVKNARKQKREKSDLRRQAQSAPQSADSVHRGHQCCDSALFTNKTCSRLRNRTETRAWFQHDYTCKFLSKSRQGRIQPLYLFNCLKTLWHCDIWCCTKGPFTPVIY